MNQNTVQNECSPHELTSLLTSEPGEPLNFSPWYHPDEVPDIRPPRMSWAAEAVYDEESGAIIGYIYEEQGIIRGYDLLGNQISLYERPLETPWLDPVDLVMLLGSGLVLLRPLLAGGSRLALRSSSRMIAAQAGYVAARAVGVSTRNAMILAFRNLTSRPLLFTATTAAWMAQPGRRVPLHILQIAVRTGVRTIDTQAARGAMTYTAPMWRQVRSGGQMVWRQYTLKVVVRESDWTVLHFHYF